VENGDSLGAFVLVSMVIEYSRENKEEDAEIDYREYFRRTNEVERPMNNLNSCYSFAFHSIA